MLRSFKCKEAERLFNGRFSKKLPQNIQRLAARKLIMLHFAASLNDLRIPPANRLEALDGDKTGQHSIRINHQWRIYFEWHQDGAYSVEIVDYR
ncbi:MAG: type II toxin-antitoxin system RelE/ParE family toxin [Desulfobacterales bacterium]|jgi:toxin HigB-1